MLIATVEFYNLPEGTPMMSSEVLTIIFALFVGSIAFTGSIVAWGKLDGFLRDSLVLPKPQIINLVMLIAAVGIILSILGIYLVKTKEGASQKDLLESLGRGINISSILVVIFSLGVLYVVGIENIQVH